MKHDLRLTDSSGDDIENMRHPPVIDKRPMWPVVLVLAVSWVFIIAGVKSCFDRSAEAGEVSDAHR